MNKGTRPRREFWGRNGIYLIVPTPPPVGDAVYASVHTLDMPPGKMAPVFTDAHAAERYAKTLGLAGSLVPVRFSTADEIEAALVAIQARGVRFVLADPSPGDAPYDSITNALATLRAARQRTS